MPLNWFSFSSFVNDMWSDCSFSVYEYFSYSSQTLLTGTSPYFQILLKSLILLPFIWWIMLVVPSICFFLVFRRLKIKILVVGFFLVSSLFLLLLKLFVQNIKIFCSFFMSLLFKNFVILEDMLTTFQLIYKFMSLSGFHMDT